MTCIKMGSDESHFNVSLIVRDKVTRQCPQTTTFLKRKESRSGVEPRSFRLPAYRLTARPNRLSPVLARIDRDIPTPKNRAQLSHATTLPILTANRRVGEGVCRKGKREIIYLSLHCHHQNDSSVKMGSDERHFNVS